MKYNITYTIIYNGSAEVEAETYDEAMKKGNEMLNNGGSTLPWEGTVGDVPFFFGEVTEDFADEID